MAAQAPARGRLSLLTRQDKVVLALMLGIPTAVHVFLVWFPALSSIVLSFTRWNGVGRFATMQPIGLKNYADIVPINPPFRHAGYILVLYLAGLKSVDPSLREAAAIDVANARQIFFRVVFPAMQPINVVVLVITIIEALRAFDLVYVVNKGRNGLELISVLVTSNIIGEASRIGFGSALAVILLVISLGAIVPYLWRTFHAESATT